MSRHDQLDHNGKMLQSINEKVRTVICNIDIANNMKYIWKLGLSKRSWSGRWAQT